MPQQCAHDVHLRVALAGDAARSIDLLEDYRRRAQRQTGATIFLWDQRGQKSRLGEFVDELSGISLLVFKSAPIRAGVARANLADGFAQFGKVFAESDLGFIRHSGFLRSPRCRTAGCPSNSKQSRRRTVPLVSRSGMRILFVTANRLGDAVLSTGLLDHLIRTYPAARFTVACGPVAEGVFQRMPNLERIVVIAKQPFGRHWLKLWRMAVTRRWDLVVDIRGSALSWLIPARRRAVMQPGNGPKTVQLARLLRLGPVPPPAG